MVIINDGVGMLLCKVTLVFLVQSLCYLSTHAEPFYPKCREDTGIIPISPASSECMFHCPMDIKHVCGTDRRPYLNPCFLCKDACKDPKLDVACYGPCPCKHKPNRDEGDNDDDFNYDHDEF